jgi:membrane-associated protein
VHIDIADLAHLATWAYLVIGGVALADAMVPVLPAETLIILGGVLAARGDLSLPLVIVAGGLGAWVGDNITYQLGTVANRKGKTPDDLDGRFGRLLAWAEAALAARGSSMLIIGRFVPGGRTALSFGAGYVRFPRSRFAVSSFLAAAIWAIYSGFIGLFGGTVFEREWWLGLLAGLAVTAVVTGLLEVARKATGRGASIGDKRVELRKERLAKARATARMGVRTGRPVSSEEEPLVVPAPASGCPDR